MWHGGEPSMLPLSYYESVLALQREVLGAEYQHHLSLPCAYKLYAVPPRILAFWKENQFRVAVSFDVISGVRVTTSGQTSEARSRRTFKRLLGDGWMADATSCSPPTMPQASMKSMIVSGDMSLYCGGRLYLNFIPLHSTPTDNGATPFSLKPQALLTHCRSSLSTGSMTRTLSA